MGGSESGWFPGIRTWSRHSPVRRCRGHLLRERGQKGHQQPTTAGPRSSNPYPQLTSRPEAGRRKPRLSRPAHRPASAPSGPEEVEGPVSGCAIAVWVLRPELRGLAGAGRTGEGGGEDGGGRRPATRGAAGKDAPGVWRRPGWPLAGSPRPSPAAGTKGPAKEAWVDSVSRRRSGTLPALCPRCQPGDSSLPCWNQTIDGGR